MGKTNIQSHILKRIEEINDELVEIIYNARTSKAQYEELVGIYNTITSEEGFSEEEVTKLSERAQILFDQNQEALMRFNEKKAVVEELQNFLEGEENGD